MRSRVLPDCWSRAYQNHAEPYKYNLNPIWKRIQYVGDPISCKQGHTLYTGFVQLRENLENRTFLKKIRENLKVREFSDHFYNLRKNSGNFILPNISDQMGGALRINEASKLINGTHSPFHYHITICQTSLLGSLIWAVLLHQADFS